MIEEPVLELAMIVNRRFFGEDFWWRTCSLLASGILADKDFSEIFWGWKKCIFYVRFVDIFIFNDFVFGPNPVLFLDVLVTISYKNINNWKLTYQYKSMTGSSNPPSPAKLWLLSKTAQLLGFISRKHLFIVSLLNWKGVYPSQHFVPKNRRWCIW